MTEIRYYLDENIDTTVGEQLVKKGVDAVTVRDLGLLGDTDTNHLQNATAMGRILCTHDTDFLQMATEIVDHAGIAFAEQYGSTIGGWVRALITLRDNSIAEDMIGQVRFLSVK